MARPSGSGSRIARSPRRSIPHSGVWAPTNGLSYKRKRHRPTQILFCPPDTSSQEEQSIVFLDTDKVLSSDALATWGHADRWCKQLRKDARRLRSSLNCL